MNSITYSLAWCLLISLSLSFLPSHAGSLSLPQPKGEILLEVSGDIRYTNTGAKARFDREMLRTLPTHVLKTHTPWTDGKRQFRGPLLRDVLSRVGADGDELRVEALNGYIGLIPISDVIGHDVILAMTMDGKPLVIRNFGPLFVLYPFDENPGLNTEDIRYRSVWQVAKIHVQ